MLALVKAGTMRSLAILAPERLRAVDPTRKAASPPIKNT
jgi:hypothetical protein